MLMAKGGMRMEGIGRGLRRVKAWLLDYAYLVTLGAAIAVIAGCAMYTEHVRGEISVQAGANAQETRTSPVPQTPAPTLRPIAAPSPARQAGVRPVSGEMLRGFDARTPVRFESLGCLQVHAAADLAGEEYERVLCPADGTVQGAVRDELWGWRVTLALDTGETLVFAGLTSVMTAPGARVRRGEALGLLAGSIPCEAEMGAHVHLEMTRGGKRVDPIAALGP